MYIINYCTRYTYEREIVYFSCKLSHEPCLIRVCLLVGAILAYTHHPPPQLLFKGSRILSILLSFRWFQHRFSNQIVWIVKSLSFNFKKNHSITKICLEYEDFKCNFTKILKKFSKFIAKIWNFLMLCANLSLRACLATCLIFQENSGLRAYKRVAYKKKNVYSIL